MMYNSLLVAVAGAALMGCGSPTHLQYDFGRSYTAAFTTQADLTRPSVAGAAHPLNGMEAVEIRLRARERVAEEKSGESELSAGAMD